MSTNAPLYSKKIWLKYIFLGCGLNNKGKTVSFKWTASGYSHDLDDGNGY